MGTNPERSGSLSRDEIALQDRELESALVKLLSRDRSYVFVQIRSGDELLDEKIDLGIILVKRVLLPILEHGPNVNQFVNVISCTAARFLNIKQRRGRRRASQDRGRRQRHHGDGTQRKDKSLEEGWSVHCF